MATSSVFSMSLLNTWGQNYPLETDTSVMLDVQTRFYSIPFGREVGTILNTLESNPMNEATNIQARLSVLLCLNNYTLTASAERKIATEFDMIDVSYDSDPKKRNQYVTFSYIRVLDNSTVTQAV